MLPSHIHRKERQETIGPFFHLNKIKTADEPRQSG
jgi:hypothetical protein